MDLASQMILFASVVDHGSFSATARSLGLTPSAVSKQIGQLEDKLGVRLLNRSSRKAAPSMRAARKFRRKSPARRRWPCHSAARQRAICIWR